eukprot:1198337-Rhodomonas_salina.2
MQHLLLSIPYAVSGIGVGSLCSVRLCWYQASSLKQIQTLTDLVNSLTAHLSHASIPPSPREASGAGGGGGRRGGDSGGGSGELCYLPTDLQCVVGTEIAYGRGRGGQWGVRAGRNPAMVLQVCYAQCGTEIGYGATRSSEACSG